EVLKFLILAPGSCLVSATVGVTTLGLAGVVHATNYFFSWWTWWVGDSIGVLIFTPLVLICAVRSAGNWPRRSISFCLPLGITFSAAVVLFIYASAWEQNRLRQEFENRADELARRVIRSFDGSVGVLQSVASLYADSPGLSRAQFHMFLELYVERHSAIRALSLNIRVPASQRGEYEAAARKEGFTEFQFTERRGVGLAAAGVREEYCRFI